MGHIVSIDKDGHLAYEGLLSSKEKATIDEILDALKKEIPQIESDLNDKYGTQLVEHNLAKVGVAGPSPVFRSYFDIFEIGY